MPHYMGLEVGTTTTKHHGGDKWVLKVETNRFDLHKMVAGELVYQGQHASMTAAAQAVRGNDRSVNGWDFFGLVNPARRTINRQRRQETPQCSQATKGKCTREGCYEPSDCKHGFCHNHCTHAHRIGAYASRQYPRTDAPHVGVEVEVVYGSDTEHKRGVTIDCHSDASLGSYGAEYKVLAKSTDVCEVTGELVKELWARRARVNRKCGMHVHLDTRQMTATQVTAMGSEQRGGATS